MEPAVIIMMLSVFFLLLSIAVGLYSLFCGLSAAGDVRRNFKTSYVIVYQSWQISDLRI